ncbi:MAG: tyrosine-type recombinase/integrase [Actinomycetota bacterium]|nr:tyrosine-type recombinase/integrase [Actinomycetota bacterium]
MDAQEGNPQTPVPAVGVLPASSPLPTGVSGATTDGRMVELWLHGKSEATKEAYRSDLSKFADFTEGRPLRTVTLADVQGFADFLSELLAPTSQARILAALKSLFAFGHQVGYLPFDVGRPVKLPPQRDQRAERILSVDDVHSMIAHAKKGRDRALIRALYIGGLRVTETVDLATRDLVARDDGRVGQLAVFGKGSKTRPVLVPRSLFDELSALALPDPEAPLFRSQKKGPDGGPRPITARQAERIVKATARKAGLKNASEVSPHWLRHAHASHAMDRGAKIHLVQATLGHSDISTTGRYLHARPDESSALYLGS